QPPRSLPSTYSPSRPGATDRPWPRQAPTRIWSRSPLAPRWELLVVTDPVDHAERLFAVLGHGREAEVVYLELAQIAQQLRQRHTWLDRIFIVPLRIDLLRLLARQELHQFHGIFPVRSVLGERNAADVDVRPTPVLVREDHVDGLGPGLLLRVVEHVAI